jgi:hypothetical protein
LIGGNVKGLLLKGFAVAALVAAVAVPAASAQSSAVKLSLLPLQKAQLGAAKSLPLQHDSGVVSNADAAERSLGPASAGDLKKLGRVTGYGLDYGIGASGGSGVTEVWTSADQYKTAADAKKGLAYWKKSDPKVAGILNQGGFAVTSKTVQVPAVGSARFADLVSYSAANIVPVSEIDEQFAEGRYEADVTVWASSAAAANKYAPAAAKALDARIKQALAGKLHAKPAKPPASQQPGAPSGGPELSTLALKASDLSGTATVKAQGYYPDPNALSDYSVFMLPAGPFDLLDQEVEWYPTANQASFEVDWATAAFLSGGGAAIDLSGVGDGAQGVLSNDSSGGFAQVVFASGRLAEFINVGSQSAVQTSDVQSTAHTAANYINTAGLGS